MEISCMTEPFKFGVITLFPDMLEALNFSMIGRAQQKELIEIQCWNPRDYTTNKHQSVDDKPYGGGPGMVMTVQPIKAAVTQAKALLGDAAVVYLSPQGQPINQQVIEKWSGMRQIILLAGRYEGIDERLIDHVVDEEWSIGDYILTGGELAAMVVIDAITRLLPGVLGDQESAKLDSFSNQLLDCPHYTRPESIHGLGNVPSVLLSGNHEAIKCWRLKQSLGQTWLKRPDLLEKKALSELERKLLDEFKAEYNRSKS